MSKRLYSSGARKRGAKKRNQTLTAEERSAVARKGGKARMSTMTSKERSELARKAGKAGGRGRKKAEGV